MNSLSVTTAPAAWETREGKWITREVRHRVEFVLDGVGLAEVLAPVAAGLSDDVTPFELDIVNAPALLRGEIPLYEEIPSAERVPVLVCACGDRECGELTVKLTMGDEDVTWSDWAVEDYHTPIRWLPKIPEFRFPAGDYAGALLAAESISEANREPVTRMRVRVPGPWWRNIVRDPEEREDPLARLGWLRVDPVEPALEEAEGEFWDFLVHLMGAQSALAGGDLGEEDRPEAIGDLQAVLDSPHRVSLPSATLDAVEWFSRTLRSPAPRTGTD